MLRLALTMTIVPLICAGCASVSIDDLSLSSVQAVDAYDQAEFGQPGDMRRILARMAGNPAIENDPNPTLQAPPGSVSSKRTHDLLLKAEFTSHVDLSKVDYGDSLGNEVFFCHRPHIHTLIDVPYVYSNGQVVPSANMAPPSQTPVGADEKPLFIYYVYFRVARDDSLTPSKSPLESFDLRRVSEDICFKVVGGAYRALGYASNVVTIPKTTITKALADAPTLPQ